MQDYKVEVDLTQVDLLITKLEYVYSKLEMIEGLMQKLGLTKRQVRKLLKIIQIEVE